MNDTGVLGKSSEWSCSETPQENVFVKPQLPCSQPHTEYPRAPEAVPISVSLPKHPASPKSQAPNAPLENRSICSGSLPDLSHYAPTDSWVQFHIHTPWTFSWLPNIPSQDSIFQNLCASAQLLVQQVFLGRKRHISHILLSFCFFLISSPSSKQKIF